MRKIMSIDAETNGLQGKAFAIAAVLRHEDGTVEEFITRCPILGKVDEWVKNNVIKEIENIAVIAGSYGESLKEFADFYKANKEDCTIIVHMGLPVEARVFIDMNEMGFIGDFDMPYPLIDVSAMLHLVGEEADSVDGFNKKLGLCIPDMEGGTHNPLYDSYAALAVYDELMRREA